MPRPDPTPANNPVHPQQIVVEDAVSGFGAIAGNTTDPWTDFFRDCKRIAAMLRADQTDLPEAQQNP